MALCSLSVYAQDGTECNPKYSIKNRWNTKLSMSFNRTNEPNDPWHSHPIRARLNVRAECNYGILDWLELGGYLGYIRHRSSSNLVNFAPVLGINVNVHLLPFWVKNKDCRWELYLTAKYGTAYLITYTPFIIDGIIIDMETSDTSYIYIGENPNCSRQIFGAGVGGGVYFWNLFGLYAEVMGGQYSYFPEACKSYYTVRIGIEFKFYSKKHKKKLEPVEKDDIIFH